MPWNPLIACVDADADRIVQTLANLLSNAVEFSPAQGTVRVRAVERGREVLFTVSDEGEGIPPARRSARLRCASGRRRPRCPAVTAKSLTHAIRLINDILDVERIAGGKLTLHRQAWSAAELLGRAVEEKMTGLAAQAQVRLEVGDARGTDEFATR